MKKLAISLALLASFALSYSQELSLGVRWLMDERLMDLAESYGRMSRMDQSASSFRELFLDDDVPVYCDFISSMDYGRIIPVGKYAAEAGRFKAQSVEISNLHKSDFFYDGERWIGQLKLDKSLKYEDGTGCVFSSLDPRIGVYHLVLDCVWLEDANVFRIISITGSSEADPSLREGLFIVVKNSDELPEGLTYGGKSLQFNDEGLAFLQSGNEFGSKGKNILSQSRTFGDGRYDIVNFQAKAARTHSPWSARLYLGGGIPGYEAKTQGSGFTKGIYREQRYIAEVGADAGLAMLSREKFKLLAWLGAGYSKGRLYFQNDSARDAEGAYASPLESYNYEGNLYDIYGFRQTIDMNDVFARLSVSPEFYLGERLALVGEFGVKAYYHLSTPETYKVAYGKNGERVNGGWSVQFSDFVKPRSSTIKPFTLALTASVGADYFFLKSMAASLHVVYDTTLGGPVYYTPSGHDSWLSPSEGIYPIIDASGTDAAYHSLFDCIDSIYRGGLALQLGVRYNF